MNAPQIPFNASLGYIRQQIVYTSTRLDADPHGEPFRHKFRELRGEWKALQIEEFDLQDERTQASAEIEFHEDGLDSFIERVDEVSAEYDRLRSLLFGDKRPYAFKRPIAGAQLMALEIWKSTLGSADAPLALQSMAPEADSLVKAAKETAARKEESNRRLKEFYSTGAKKKFIEKVNRARSELFRYVTQLMIERPELQIDGRYALSFFLRKGNETVLPLEEEIAILRGQIEDQQEILSLLESRLFELVAQKESRERETAEERARHERIESLQRELIALQGKRRRL